MNPRAPHQDAICQRQHNFTICKRPRHEHVGELYACPDGSGRTYKRHPTSKTRAGNTFTMEEATALRELCGGMLDGQLRNGAATEWTRRNAKLLGTLLSKAKRMQASLVKMAKEIADEEVFAGASPAWLDSHNGSGDRPA